MTSLGVSNRLFVGNAKVDIPRALIAVANIVRIRQRKAVPRLWAHEFKLRRAVADCQVGLHCDVRLLPKYRIIHRRKSTKFRAEVFPEALRRYRHNPRIV